MTAGLQYYLSGNLRKNKLLQIYTKIISSVHIGTSFPMIYIFYSLSCAQLPQEAFQALLQQVPVAQQNQVLRFMKWEDRQRSLFGKMLLKKGLQLLGLSAYSLEALKYTNYSKPYFDNSIDFNISHSGDYIVCAISKTGKLGIDIEWIQPIPLCGFEEQFSEKEWRQIIKAKDNLHAFYTYWTQKEAFIKAIGTGLHLPLNRIAVNNNKIIWEGREWHLHKIELAHDYVSHLATTLRFPQIAISQLDFA